jgi:beta-1,4-N-acetylglucosaminyltransferase
VIFVAVGTTDFSALAKAVDELAPTLAEKVVMQIGHSRYEPKYCEYFRFVPSLAPYYECTSLVISHGGLGIVTEVMSRQLPLVAVEDPQQPDQHQKEILSVWNQEGYLVWCRDLSQLAPAMAQARSHRKPYNLPECHLHTIITEFLDKLKA